MTTTRRHFVQAIGSAAALGALYPLTGFAQTLEQVKIMYGFPAGSAGDSVARRVAEKLGGTAYSKNPGFVENKPGAGGRIAVETLKNSPADGSVLTLAPVSALSVYPHIYPKLSYKPEDVTPVSIGAIMHHGLAVGPAVPAEVKTLKDFTEKDRIAVPAVGVSVQSRFLQYAAAKQWGDKEFNRLDKYTIAVPHPDATAALIAGGTELTGHFSNPPFQDQALANPNVHVVLNTYDLLGPNSPTVLFATEKFRNDNPKTYKAFIDALTEAAQFAQNDKGAAADTYIRVTKAKIDRAALLKIIDNPQFEFSVTPKNTYPLAEFLYRVGAIKNKPESWKDYFFQDAKPLQGS